MRSRRPASTGEEEDATDSSPVDGGGVEGGISIIATNTPTLLLPIETGTSSSTSTTRGRSQERDKEKLSAQTLATHWDPQDTFSNGRPSTAGSCSSRASPSCSPSPNSARTSSERLVDEKMELLRPIRSRRPRLKSAWACSVWTVSVALVTIFMIATMVHSFTKRHCDSKGCKMSYCRPS